MAEELVKFSPLEEPGRRPLPVVVHGQVRGDKVTARRQGVQQRRDDLGRLVGIGEQVQDPQEQQAGRLAGWLKSSSSRTGAAVRIA